MLNYAIITHVLNKGGIIMKLMDAIKLNGVWMVIEEHNHFISDDPAFQPLIVKNGAIIGLDAQDTQADELTIPETAVVIDEAVFYQIFNLSNCSVRTINQMLSLEIAPGLSPDSLRKLELKNKTDELKEEIGYGIILNNIIEEDEILPLNFNDYTKPSRPVRSR